MSSAGTAGGADSAPQIDTTQGAGAAVAAAPAALGPDPAAEVDPSAPAPDAPAAGDSPATAAEEPAGEAVADPASPAAPAIDPPLPEWRQKQFNKVYARLKAVEAERDALKAAQPGADAGLTEADVQRRAEALASQQTFIAQVKQADTLGRATYADFDTRVARVYELANTGTAAERSAYDTLLRTAMETGQAHRIMYELGGDMAKASEMLELAAASPVKMALEVAKMSLVKGEPEPSKAPKPITPIGGRGSSLNEIAPSDPVRADKLSTEEWMRRRNAEIAAGASR